MRKVEILTAVVKINNTAFQGAASPEYRTGTPRNRDLIPVYVLHTFLKETGNIFVRQRIINRLAVPA